MPYIDPKRREIVKADPSLVSDYGELNYIITLNLIDRWKQKPRYETMHVLRRDKERIIMEISEVVSHKFTFLDLRAAFDEALAEFRERVIKPYEEHKREQNGDVY